MGNIKNRNAKKKFNRGELTMSIFTKKHYQAIATDIACIVPYNQEQEVILTRIQNCLEIMFMEDNEAFDINKFRNYINKIRSNNNGTVHSNKI